VKKPRVLTPYMSRFLANRPILHHFMGVDADDATAKQRRDRRKSADFLAREFASEGITVTKEGK